MKKEKEQDDLNLIRLAREFSDDDKAREMLEEMRWPDGVVCPHCKNAGEKAISKITPQPSSKSAVRRGVYFCGACRKQFTVTVGTIFEGSHIPIGSWMMAIFIFCASKKSISANQLHRMLGITYKSAWFMAHRLRHAIGPDLPVGKMLSGVVEVDETFVGPRSDTRHAKSSKKSVVALVERGGQMRTQVVANITQKNAGEMIRQHVSKDAVLNTDEHAAYRGRFKDYKRHDVVNHSRYEYSRMNKDGTKSGINTCESFFGLFKRGIVGSWHHISKEHLAKYANEFAFRWNTRGDTDGKRMEKFVPMTEGKRLTYKPLIGKS